MPETIENQPPVASPISFGGNNVRWLEWTLDTFKKAQREDKPLYVFIGYSASEGARLMSQHVLVDEEVCEVLNENFLPVLVDKNLQPSVADFYLKAMRSTGEPGGWPLSAFCDSEGRPYFLGTYYGKTSQFGKPPFIEVCQTMAKVYATKREHVLSSCKSFVADVKAIYDSFESGSVMSMFDLDDSIHVGASKRLMEHWDSVNGGFGTKPKFPFLKALLYLSQNIDLAFGKEFRFAFLHQCKCMAKNQIIDLEAGGVHAYSTSNDWNSPVHEKTLVDQSLLLRVYSRAHELADSEEDKELFFDVLKSTVSVLGQHFLQPSGGFAHYLSSEDAHCVGPVLCASNAMTLCSLMDASKNVDGLDASHLIEKVYPWMLQRFVENGEFLFKDSGRKVKGTLGDYGAFALMCLKISERHKESLQPYKLAVALSHNVRKHFVSTKKNALSIDSLDITPLLPLRPYSYEDEAEPSEAFYVLKSLIHLSAIAAHEDKNEFDELFQWVKNYICSKSDLARQRPIQMTHILDLVCDLTRRDQIN